MNNTVFSNATDCQSVFELEIIPAGDIFFIFWVGEKWSKLLSAIKPVGKEQRSNTKSFTALK